MRAMLRASALAAVAVFATAAVTTLTAPEPQTEAAPPAEVDPRIERLKDEASADIDGRRVFIQRMVDSLFSFAELGFQEFETQRYITQILRDEGFEIELGVAGIPSGWIARCRRSRPTGRRRPRTGRRP